MPEYVELGHKGEISERELMEQMAQAAQEAIKADDEYTRKLGRLLGCLTDLTSSVLALAEDAEFWAAMEEANVNDGTDQGL